MCVCVFAKIPGCYWNGTANIDCLWRNLAIFLSEIADDVSAFCCCIALDNSRTL